MTTECRDLRAHADGRLCRTCGYGRHLHTEDESPRDRRVPVSAALVGTALLTSPHLPPGESVRVTLYDGQASHGYRTNYQHVAQAWLVLTRSWQDNTWQSRRSVTRYSGKRHAQARVDFDSVVASGQAVAA
ncbi:MAG: hypothetical protein E6G45_14480 [Actinobacteria bacterium]|nr:MAG: hypothetical protein E6G45_14480 [Actinomycetota bacterium]